ncbi:hypothetical protein VNO78_25069 [Psophocarpus tetragonolobus]|uniref:Uncharacterized protein n=1 Tax=Psophocarpus tetragonolobus TaxID=3891 RepID=A0AAN9XF33_PSOTE
MANPISIRPWSRLASLRSSPVSDSHPKAHIAEPSFKTTNASSNDNNSNSAAATKSLPTSPNVHNGIHSQNLKLITPMTFPPAKLKVHPQPMVEVTMEKPNANDNASLKNESGQTKNQGNEKQATNKENKMKEKGAHTKVSGSEGRGTRVITISGENRGAYMQIIQSQKKPIHKMGNCDGEKVKTVCSPPMRAMYGNSNVQCVNNSMLFHTSLTHNDPGVHIIIPKKPIRVVDDQRN